MRVLLVPYPDTSRIEGGHRTQQTETALALARAGVDAVVAELGETDPAGFDVVHFFGDPRPLLRRGRPSRLVVSPVHFPRALELGPLPSRAGRLHGLHARLRHRARCLRYPGGRARQVAEFRARLEAVAQADVIVTNSRAEAVLLAADARRPLPRVRVAYSGVAPEFFDGSPDEGRRVLGLDEPFVLCVARVEPIKNQLSLALAMRRFPHRRLVLVGAVLPGNEPYLEACRRALPSLLHVPHVERGRLPDVYAAADVHVLPSWYETTGLATMEAAAAGTPVVVGRSPCVEDYFSDCAEFAGPASIAELRAAIGRALDRPRGSGRDVARRFSWDRTAEELLDAYAA